MCSLILNLCLPVFALSGNASLLANLFQLSLFLGSDSVWCLINVLEVINIHSRVLTHSFGLCISWLVWKKSSCSCTGNDGEENNGLKKSKRIFFLIHKDNATWVKEGERYVEILLIVFFCLSIQMICSFVKMHRY